MELKLAKCTVDSINQISSEGAFHQANQDCLKNESSNFSQVKQKKYTQKSPFGKNTSSNWLCQQIRAEKKHSTHWKRVRQQKLTQ